MVIDELPNARRISWPNTAQVKEFLRISVISVTVKLFLHFETTDDMAKHT